MRNSRDIEREIDRDIDRNINAIVGLGCLVLLFKAVALAAIVLLVFHAINSFS